MFDNKFLYIGNNLTDTDHRVTQYAKELDTVNHGLIESVKTINHPGLYHTTLVDITAGELLKLSAIVDKVILLDQPREEWSSQKLLWDSYEILKEIEKSVTVEFRNNKNVEDFLKFDSLLNENKSFCIYPWINFVAENGLMRACARTSSQSLGVASKEIITNWKSNQTYKKIREKMLAGEKLPEYCSVCYDYEDKDIVSYRIHETKEWVSKLQIKSLDDLEKISSPLYYEMRLTNTCNIMCRSCIPQHSSLIHQEYMRINLVGEENFKPQHYSDIKWIDIDNITTQTRIYLTGGEPTAIKDVYTFMEQCIEKKKTDFELTMCTNAVKISDKFLGLAKHFTSMNFSISLDGYGIINDYWRWGSDWDTVIRNTKTLEAQGHSISINTVPGIYNVTNLHLLYEFLDREFPKTLVYLQLNHNPVQSVFNHPNAELVVESMRRCQQTNVYYANGKSNKSGIDSIFDHYAKNPGFNKDTLRQFFEFNDKLDESRGVRLADYIPELEECRKYLK